MHHYRESISSQWFVIFFLYVTLPHNNSVVLYVLNLLICTEEPENTVKIWIVAFFSPFLGDTGFYPRAPSLQQNH